MQRISVSKSTLQMSGRGPLWRGGLVVGRRTCDRSREFEARPRRCCATNLGKLFTPYCLCHQSWEVNRHIAWCTNPYHVVSQCSLVPGCWVGLRRSAPTYGKRYRIRGGASRRCAIQIHVLFTFFTTTCVPGQRLTVQTRRNGFRPARRKSH